MKDRTEMDEFCNERSLFLFCRGFAQRGGWALLIMGWMIVLAYGVKYDDRIVYLGTNTTAGVSAVAHGPSWLTMDCRKDLEALVDTNTGVVGSFSLYLEDLSNGTFFAIRADEPYEAWSLFKVPVLMTVLKNVENGRVSIDAMVPITRRQVSYAATPIDDIKGEAAPLKVLAQRMLQLSDNTASIALAALFKPEEFQRTLAVAGIPPPPPDQTQTKLPKVTPRQFAAMFRVLRNASYLNETYSEWVLSLLAESMYDSQIVAGVPPGTRASHMVGFNGDCGDFHDCGIIWNGAQSYLLCVMSHGSTREEADQMISSISRRIWECYVKAHRSSLVRPGCRIEPSDPIEP